MVMCWNIIRGEAFLVLRLLDICLWRFGISLRYIFWDTFSFNYCNFIRQDYRTICNIRKRRCPILRINFYVRIPFYSTIISHITHTSLITLISQFAQQRLKKGAVIGGWVSSFYLLLPAGLTPFLGIFIDVYGQRITLRMYSSLMHNVMY